MFSSDPFHRITAGGTFQRTFQIFAANYKVFLIMSGIIFLPLSLVSITMNQILGSSWHTVIDGSMNNNDNNNNNNSLLDSASFNGTYYDPHSTTTATATAAGSDPFNDALMQNMSRFGTQFVVEYIVLLIVSIAGKSAMSFAVAEMYVGRDPSWLDCYKKGMSRWCAVFGDAVLVGFGVGLCQFVIEIFVVILIFLVHNYFMTFLAFLIIAAWLVVLTYVMVSLMILAPVIMVESTGPINAINRCWELSNNNRCYIFCTAFCLFLVYYAFQLVLSAILFAMGGGDAAYSIGGAFLVVLPALIYVPLQVM